MKNFNLPALSSFSKAKCSALFMAWNMFISLVSPVKYMSEIKTKHFCNLKKIRLSQFWQFQSISSLYTCFGYHSQQRKRKRIYKVYWKITINHLFSGFSNRDSTWSAHFCCSFGEQQVKIAGDISLRAANEYTTYWESWSVGTGRQRVTIRGITLSWKAIYTRIR